MAREFSRSRRVAELIQRELARLIDTEIQDPRVGRVTITEVDLSRDLRNARVFIAAVAQGVKNNPNADQTQDETIKALTHAVPFLRRQLSKQLAIRGCPQLSFYVDDTLENGNRLNRLIKDALSSSEDR